MKAIVPMLLALTLAAPVAAQDLVPPPLPEPEEESRGADLIEEGAKLLLRGLMEEMDPALDEMGKALSEMEPAIRDLMALIDDIRHYHAPEIMPNGDIIIRKKTPGEIAADGEGEIEL
jgi:hypothetical protein